MPVSPSSPLRAPARPRRRRPLTVDLLESRLVPTVTWQVQSDYFNFQDGISQTRSLRGIALTQDGESVYGGFINGSSTMGVRKVDADVLAIPGSDTVIFGNHITGASPQPKAGNPVYKGGATGDYEADQLTGGDSPAGIATDDRGNVFVTTRLSTSSAVKIYNSDLSSAIGIFGPSGTPTVAVQKIGSTYYAYIALATGGKAALIQRYDVTNPSLPVHDTSFGAGGTVNLQSGAGFATAYINAFEVDDDGTIYAGGGIGTFTGSDPRRRGDSVFKIPADGNMANALRTDLPGAFDVAIFGSKIYVTKYTGAQANPADGPAVAVFNKSDLSSAGGLLFTGFARTQTGDDHGYSGIDVSYDGRLYVSDQVYAVQQTNTTPYTPPATTFNPTPVTYTGTTGRIVFDRILVSSQVEAPAIVYVSDTFTGANGTIVDGDPLTAGFQKATIGYDAFAVIQDGIDNVQDGGIVKIFAGSFTGGLDSTAKSVEFQPFGVVNLSGSIALDSDDTLVVPIDGEVAGVDFPQLVPGGSVSLGNADLSIALGYTPDGSGTSLIIIDDTAISGTFLQGPSSPPFTITYTGGDVTLVIPPALASISGTVFVDFGDLGVFDSGDVPLEGITVYIDRNDNNVFDGGEESTVTHAAGEYSFSDLAPGTFGVRLVLAAFNQNTNDFFETVNAGDNLTEVDLGVRKFSAAFAPPANTVTTAPPGSGVNEAIVEGFYRVLLGRDGEPAGVEGFATLLDNGASTATVVDLFLRSAEYSENLVKQYYRTFLGREGDAEGIKSWTDQILAGTSTSDVIVGFLTSAEYTGQFSAPDKSDYIESVYLSILGRAAGTEGVSVWTSSSFEGIARGIVDSAESHHRTVAALYAQVFNRPLDPGGQLTWEPLAGNSLSDLIAILLDSDEFRTRAGG